MLRNVARPAALALVVGLMACGSTRAADTIRLGGKYSDTLVGGAGSTLKDAGGTLQRLDRRAGEDDADNVKVWHRGWGGWGGHHGWGGWGGHRGWGWGGYRGWGWGGYRGLGWGWGGYRGWGWGGYRGWGWGGWYRPSVYIGIGSYPYWGGYGYSYPYYNYYDPLYTSGYSYSYPVYSSYYSYPVYSGYYSSPIVYSSYGGFCPIGGTTATNGAALTLEARPQQTMPFASDYTQPTAPAPQRMPPARDSRAVTVPPPNGGKRPVPPPPAPGDGTFPYDGGPAKPVPLPRPNTDVPPSKEPSTPAAPTERMVSLPKKKAYVYPAYGDDKAAPKAADDTTYVKATPSQTR